MSIAISILVLWYAIGLLGSLLGNFHLARRYPKPKAWDWWLQDFVVALGGPLNLYAVLRKFGFWPR